MLKSLICFIMVLAVNQALAAISNNVELLDYNSVGTEVEDSVMGVSCWGYEKDGVEYAIIGKGLYYDFDDKASYMDQCSLLVYSIDAAGDLSFEIGYPGVVYPEEIVVYQQNDSVYAYLCGHCDDDSVYVYNLTNYSKSAHISAIYSDYGVHGMHVDNESGVLFMGRTCGFQLRMYNVGTNPKNPRLLGTWSVPTSTVYDIHDEYDTEDGLWPDNDDSYTPGISDIYVTGSPDDNSFRVFIAAVRSGLFIADITDVTLNDTLASLSISSTDVRQIKYQACRVTAEVDSDYALCHSVWLDDNEEYIFVGTEVNYPLVGNHLGALSVFELDSDDIDNLVNINHANSPNVISSFAVYDVLNSDTKGTVYNDISQLNTGEVDSNTCIHFVFFRDNYLYISYYNKGLRILKFDPSSSPIMAERAYWDPEVNLDYSGDDPVLYLGTYGPTFGTYGVYPFLPSGRIITSSHDGLRVFEYAKSGTVAVNETWIGNVVVGGDIVVKSGVTLTIAAGCTIEVIAGKDYTSSGVNSGKVEFIINGALVAESSTDSIIFSSSAPTPGTRDWYGIRNYGYVSLKRCRVEYADYPVRVYSTADSTRIENSALENYYYHGVNVSSGGPLFVKNCRIGKTSSSSSRGISMSSSISSAEIDGNTIHNLTGTSTLYGIYVSSTVDNADVKITNNTITNIDNGSTRRGMYLRGDYTLASHNLIKDFNGTAGYAFYVSGASNDTLRGNVVYNDQGSFSRGIFTSSCSNISIEHDTVADCASKGIELYNTTGDLFDNVVEDNLMYAYAVYGNGSGTDAYIEGNHVRAYNRDTSCYIGVAAIGYADLKLRESTIEDYWIAGVASGGTDGVVDCGTSGDNGDNNIYWNITGDSVLAGYYFLINDDYTDSMDAVMNYYGSSNPSSSYFSGPIDYVPYRTSAYSARPAIPPHVNSDISIGTSIGVYPNPTTHLVSVNYEVSTNDAMVVIQVLDSNGSYVTTLVNAMHKHGQFGIEWDCKDARGVRVISGIYIIKQQVGDKIIMNKVMFTD